jgi:uncharacterized protein YbjT (DUF2867 family)
VIVIFAATGNVGLPLALSLARAKAPVRALVRDCTKAQLLADAGVELVEGDLCRKDDVHRVLIGATRVFVNTPIHDDMERMQIDIIDRCAQANVKYVVRLSTPASAIESSMTVGRCHGAIDAALTATRVPHALLKPVLFMQNFLKYESVWEEAALYAAAGDGKIAAIDARDIADVAATLLLEDSPRTGDFLLTGPKTLSFAEMASAIGRALGSEVRYHEVTPESARHYITKGGTPGWLADDLLQMYAMMKLGTTAQTVDTVREVARHDARTFEAFTRDAVDRFRGGPLPVLV